MAGKISSGIQGDIRKGFLLDLRDDPDRVTKAIARCVDGLAMGYIFTDESDGTVLLNVDEGDDNALISQAKHIVEYLRDELLTDELATA